MKKYLALEASAGSGKTFALAIRYLSLLFLGERIDEIVCLTFTNKARLEMQERVSYLLKNIHKDLNVLKELSIQTGFTKKYIAHNASKVAELFENNQNRIFTIDSMINKLLKHYAVDIGIESDFNIGVLHPNTEIEKFMEILKNKEYFNNVEFIKKNLSIEDKEFIELFFYLYSNNFAIDLIMKDYEDVVIEEFYTAFEYLEELKRENNLQKDILKQYFKIKEFLVIYNILNLYKVFKISLIDTKKEANILNFDDVSHLMFDFIKDQNKDISHFRCNHLLIDEFQDTSILQYKILEPFIEDILNSENGTFFYVGDIKQSLYRFRGSNSKLFKYIFKSKNLELETLENNYRSSKELVDFINNKSSFIFDNYKNQKSNKIFSNTKNIKITDFDDNLSEILNREISLLLSKGIKEQDIAILLRNNFDIENIKKDLSEYFIFNNEETTYICEEKGVQEFINIDCDISKIENIEMEDNIKKIIKKESKKFKKTIDFIYHLEKMSIKNEIENSGLNILTVHKSKGLEFDYVFLIDSLKEYHEIDEKVFIHNEDIFNFSLNIDFIGRSEIDEEFKNRKIDANRESLIDEKNVFYVGITRAKEGLNILINKKIDQRKSLSRFL